MFRPAGYMLAFGRPILLLFGDSNDTISFAADYMNIYCLGTLFIQLTLGLNAFITAQGKTLVSMGNVAVGAVTNIVLDALLINGFGMGVKGAALATIISQGVSACFVIRYLCTEKSTLRLRLRNIRFDRKLLWPCILLGTSPALMQLTENLVAISFNTSLQTYGGDMAVASMSILSSVMQFVMLLLPGLVQGAQPLLSYDLGAKNIPRVKKTFRLLLVCCVGGSFLIWLLCMAAPGAVASIFTDDAALIAYTTWSMRIYPHAPWWNYTDVNEVNYNPTASLIGFILLYASPKSSLYQTAQRLLREAYAWFQLHCPLESMHTASCFVELFEDLVECNISGIDLSEFKSSLQRQMKHILTADTSVWASEYVCKLSLMIHSRSSRFYEENKELCDFECYFLSETQQEDGTWAVTWDWECNPEQWHISKHWWKSDLIIKNVKFYRNMQ